jgi:hypothetical protein
MCPEGKKYHTFSMAPGLRILHGYSPFLPLPLLNHSMMAANRMPAMIMMTVMVVLDITLFLVTWSLA